MEKLDLYKTLQIDPEAEPAIVMVAYKRLALMYHPDTNRSVDANRRMQQINLAYEILSDPEKRREYDMARQAVHAARREPAAEAQRTAGQTPSPSPAVREPQRKWLPAAARGGVVGVCLLGALALTTTSTSIIPASNSPTPTPSYVTLTRATDGSRMVFVPAGTFVMGSLPKPDDEGYSAERPHHSVNLDAFWIDQTEVTNRAYQKCVKAGDCRPSDFADSADLNGGDQPVTGVNWFDASTYCQWAGARLPTEAEWEKAARGTDGRTFPWGDEAADCSLAVMDHGCARGVSWPVGSKPAGASPYGVFDMAGNVWEWVNDWYGDGYYGTSPQNNPTGPQNGTEKVMRGGSYLNSSYFGLRSVHRAAGNPNYRILTRGFRCALDAAAD